MAVRTEQTTGLVDLNALRTNQVCIVTLVALGFVIGGSTGGALVALVAMSLAIGLLWPGNGPFQLLYGRVLVPSGIVKRSLEPGVPAQHRFAQLLGTIVSAAAAVLILGGFSTIGWMLAGMVAVLALVNLVFGFCVGCFIHLQIGRWRENGATL